MSEVKEHIHKYERRILGGRKVVFYIDERGKRKKRLEKTGGYETYRCVFPGCTHYVPYENAVGRKSVCWTCGEELILTKDRLKAKRPIHEHCQLKREVVA